MPGETVSCKGILTYFPSLCTARPTVTALAETFQAEAV